LSRQLTKKLRTARPLRKRRRRPDQRRARFIAPAVLIDHRPSDAALRLRIGDWEGDLIIGRSSQSAIGTLVDGPAAICACSICQPATTPTPSATGSSAFWPACPRRPG
jgi:IS30 family transposase